MEFEAFGFYLSDHPTKYYMNLFKDINLSKLSKLNDRKNSAEDNTTIFLNSIFNFIDMA